MACLLATLNGYLARSIENKLYRSRQALLAFQFVPEKQIKRGCSHLGEK
jgi:hypothetical protein